MQGCEQISSAMVVCQLPAYWLQRSDGALSGESTALRGVHAPCRPRSAKSSPPQGKMLHLSQAQVSPYISARLMSSCCQQRSISGVYQDVCSQDDSLLQVVLNQAPKTMWRCQH